MSMSKVAVILGVVLAVFNIAYAQTVYVVGDSSGWIVPQSASLYQNWASSNKFFVGDILSNIFLHLYLCLLSLYIYILFILITQQGRRENSVNSFYNYNYNMHALQVSTSEQTSTMYSKYQPAMCW